MFLSCRLRLLEQSRWCQPISSSDPLISLRDGAPSESLTCTSQCYNIHLRSRSIISIQRVLPMLKLNKHSHVIIRLRVAHQKERSYYGLQTISIYTTYGTPTITLRARSSKYLVMFIPWNDESTDLIFRSRCLVGKVISTSKRPFLNELFCVKITTRQQLLLGKFTIPLVWYLHTTLLR